MTYGLLMFVGWPLLIGGEVGCIPQPNDRFLITTNLRLDPI
jgi:hypothetical protein